MAKFVFSDSDPNRIKYSQLGKHKPYMIWAMILTAYLLASQPGWASTLTVDYLTMRPMSALFLSDLETVPGIVDYSIRNTGGSAISAVLEVEIRNGSGSVVFKGATDPNRYPISLAPGESRKLSNNMIKSGDLDYSTVAYDRSLLGSVMATGKIPAGTYVYTIKVYPAGNPGDYSSMSNQFVLTNPGPPNLISPLADAELGSASTLAMSFSWTAPAVDSSIGLSYEFTVWEILNGQSAETAANKNPFWSEKSISKTSYDYPTRAPQFGAGKSYAWQVRAYDNTGAGVGENYGKSAIRAFRFQDFQAPVLQSPVDVDVTTLTPTFQWSPVDGANSYRLEISTSSSFSNAIAINSSVSSFTLQTELEYNTIYYWRVQAFDGSGAKIAGASKFGRFNTPIFGQSPKIIQPASTSLADLIPHFVWQGVEGADSYELQLSQNSALSSPWTVLLPGSNLQWDFDAGKINPLVLGNRYYWRIQAKKGGKNWGTSSEIASFDTPQLNQRPIVTIGAGENALVPRLEWTPIEGADRYYISVSSRPDFKDSWGTFANGTQLSNRAVFSQFELGHQYYFQVQGIQKNGRVLGYPSDVVSFLTPEPPRPVLNGPVGDIGIDQLKFQWQSVPGVDRYLIEFSPARDFSKSWSKVESGLSSSYTSDMAKLNPNSSYYWRVRPIDKNGISGIPSETGYFRLAIPSEQVQKLIEDGNPIINPNYMSELARQFSSNSAKPDSSISRQAEADLIRLAKENPKLLAAVDPRRIDLNEVGADAINALKSTDISGAFKDGWLKAKDAISKISLDPSKALSGIDLNKYFAGILSGMSAKDAESNSRIYRPVAVDPSLVRVNQALNLSESDKLKRILISQLSAMGIDMTRYQITDVRINGRSGIPDFLKSQIRDGEIGLTLKEESK